MEKWTRKELGENMIDHGAWSEFHQKRGNWTMYDWHHGQYIAMQKEYFRRYFGRAA